MSVLVEYSLAGISLASKSALGPTLWSINRRKLHRDMSPATVIGKLTLNRCVTAVLLFGLLQIADLANNHHPIAHLLLGVCRHIISSVRCLHVKHMLEFNTVSIESQPGVHLFHLIQINDPFPLSTAHVRVVFEKKLTRKLALL